MSVLRDIVASFSIKVDDKPLKSLNDKIGATKALWRNMALAGVAALGAVTVASYGFVQAASRVEENLNLLKVTFGDNTASVIEWSKEFGKAAQRSEFGLQKSVSRIGTLFKGMMDDVPLDTIETMSKKLSELVVDVASFRDKTEEEVLMSLESGLMGETESVRRLGVDISVGQLEKDAKEAGISKPFKNMSNDEKILLRYNRILRSTEDAQGDAVRTAESWANQTRNITDQISKLAVKIGQQLMPRAKALIGWLTELVKGLLESRKSIVNMFDASVITGLTLLTAHIYYTRDAIIATIKQSRIYLFVMKMWSSATLLAKIRFAALTLAAGGFFLIVEDILAGFKGMDSALGRTLALIYDMESPTAALQRMWGQIVVHAQKLGDVLSGDVDGAISRQAKFDNLYDPAHVARRLNPRIQQLITSGQVNEDAVYGEETRKLAPGLSREQIRQAVLQQYAAGIASGAVAPDETAFNLGLIPESAVGGVADASALNNTGRQALAASQGVNAKINIEVKVEGDGDPKKIEHAVRVGGQTFAEALADRERRKAAKGTRGGR